MAAIAYVSDEKMLDYHRTNGCQEIVFWRTSTKRFSSFQPGDLLFFLTKVSGRRKEKGIVGYGCFVEEKQMSVDSLWKRYAQKTGYNSKAELKQAILSKTERIPEKISCLFLDKVIFFMGPIYLSELGIKLPANLESFTYLDTHEGHVTLELLQKVKETGLDFWSASLNTSETDPVWFNNEIMRFQIASVYESMDITGKSIPSSFRKKCLNMFRYRNPQWVNNEQNSFVLFKDGEIKLYYIFYSTQKEMKKNYLHTLGEVIFIRNALLHTINENIRITLLSSLPFTDIQRESLLDNRIEYELVE